MTFVDGHSKSLEYLNFLFISRKKTAFGEAFRVSNSKERYVSETDLRRGRKYLSRRVANKLFCKVIVFFLLLWPLKDREWFQALVDSIRRIFCYFSKHHAISRRLWSKNSLVRRFVLIQVWQNFKIPQLVPARPLKFLSLISCDENQKKLWNTNVKYFRNIFLLASFYTQFVLGSIAGCPRRVWLSLQSDRNCDN